MSRKSISAGGVVLNRHGQVLVVNQRGNSWSLPKGHVDPGESLLDAAKREIQEESGIGEIKLLQKVGWYRRARIGKNGGEDKSEVKTLHFFLFSTKKMKLSPLDKDNPEARWVKLADVAALLTHPRDKEFILRKKNIIRQWSGK